MKSVVLLIISLILACCKPHGKVQFLQDNKVQLASPKLTASNKIIDSAALLQTEMKMDGVTIFYTDDGQEPNAEGSFEYKRPISVLRPGTYKFKAFHPEWRPSETAVITFVKMGQTVDSVIWSEALNQKYSGKGQRTLVNHKKAGVNYSDQEWLGFDAPSAMTCIFDRVMNISSIDIGYLNHPGAWIFPPGSVQIFTSEDGHVYQVHSKNDLPQPQGMNDAAQQTYNIPLNKNVKSIKLVFENVAQIPGWHEGKDQKGWMFMDEIIFNK